MLRVPPGIRSVEPKEAKMHDKAWYKKNYEFYKAAYMAQVEYVKELEKEVRELKSVMHSRQDMEKIK